MNTPPDQPRLALAEARAQKLLLGERILKPPVPVRELLEQFAIVCPFDHQREPSFCLEQDLIWYVFINSNISERSVSFIQAHEMGHLFMDHLGIDRTSLTEPQFQVLKREADHFAYNLLIPENWLRSACDGNCVKESGVAYLAGMYSVTPATMKNRLRHLGIQCREDAQNGSDIIRKASAHDAKNIAQKSLSAFKMMITTGKK